MSTEVDTFLEHYGVKGQKWGIRNIKNIGQRREGETPAQHRARKQKNARRIVRGVRLAGAAVIISTVLSQYGKHPVSNLSDRPKYKYVLNKSIEHPMSRLDKQKQLHGAAEMRKLLKRMGEDVIG